MNKLFKIVQQHGVILILALFIITGIVFREEIFNTADSEVADRVPETAVTTTPGSGAAGLESIPDNSQTSTPGPVAIDEATTSITERVESENPTETAQSGSGMGGESQPAQAPRVVAEPQDPPGEPELNLREKTDREPVHATTGERAVSGEDETPDVTTTPPNHEVDKSDALNFRPIAQQDVETGLEESTPTVQQYLSSARQAYWMGDESKAIAIYKTLINNNPVEADYHGELGNIYYKRGDRKLALDAYRQAVMILRETDETSAADSFIKQVTRVDNDLGMKLQGMRPDRSE